MSDYAKPFPQLDAANAFIGAGSQQALLDTYDGIRQAPLNAIGPNGLGLALKALNKVCQALKRANKINGKAPITNKLDDIGDGSNNIVPKKKPENIASETAQGFKNLECKDCVKNIVKKMKAQGEHGEILDVTGPTKFIWSDRLGKNISKNGTHRAVKVGDTVFDNHNPNGIPYTEWFEDLHAPGGLTVDSTPF